AGITERERLQDRVATVSFLMDGHPPAEIVNALAAEQIHARYGDYYAVEVMRRYGRSEEGMVRVGAVHYNTRAEIDHFLNVLSSL
ncbi:MAG: aminotransferase class V-fold PLP-dependent enzyme, partial [Anaerolineae bacterium]|nr:aminotransferase class V-fold PLP-dependent enzyme [Anaerolineae bacterium]